MDGEKQLDFLKKIFPAKPMQESSSLQRFKKQVAQRMRKQAPQGYLMLKLDMNGLAKLEARYGHVYGEAWIDSLTQAIETMQGQNDIFTLIEHNRYLLFTEFQPDFIQQLQQSLTNADTMQELERYVGTTRFVFGAYHVKDTTELVDDMVDKVSLAHKTAALHRYKDIVWYDAALVQVVEQENYFNEHLLEAIENQDIKIYLQRQIELKNSSALRAKALARWVMPDGRMVYQDAFIPQFEKNGLICHLDFYVLEQVCKYSSTVTQQHGRAIVLNINCAMVTVSQPNFIPRVMAIVQKYGVLPQNLVIEIQQLTFMDGAVIAQENIQQLIDAGFVIAVDIVASGQLDLRLQTEFDISMIKFDRRFLRAADTNQKVKCMIPGIVAIAHSLGVQVMCEGVEHAADVAFLAQFGCDIAQGYYLMKACPQEEFLYAADQNAADIKAKIEA